MGCAASSRQNDPAAKAAASKKKDKGKDKKAKEEEQIQATLEPDEVINCFNDLDDQDVGLKLIVEKEPELIKDIKMTSTYFTELETNINKEIVFPDTQEHIKALYDKCFNQLERTDEGVPEEEKRKLYKNFIHKHNIIFKTQELKVFTEAEVYHPLLSKNKHEYIKLIFKQVKNFVTSLKAHKKLIYEPCRAYLVENQKRYGVGTLLDKFQIELSRASNMNKYWMTEATKADDHVLDAYNIFDHNMNVLVKLVLIFYEKCNMEYQVLSKPENKINYNILMNNFLFWSVTNLEKSNFPVYKLYLSELSRLNHLLNQKIGKSRLIELIFKYRGESYTFFQNLKEIKVDIEKNLFGVLKNNGTVLHKPLKEKFNQNFQVLIQETLPTIYDKYDKFKEQVESEVRDHLSDFFNRLSPPFNIKTLVRLDKSMDEKNGPQYLMNMYTVIMYIQAEIFKTKFNLDPEHYKRRAIRIYEMFGIQLNETQLEDLKSLRDSITSEPNYSATFDSLQSDAEKIIKEYNTKKISREMHVYVLCSMFLCLSGLELRREGSKYIYKQHEYLSDSRDMLFKLTNRMRNFDFAMSNWTLINYMEFKIEDFLEEYTLANSSKIQTQAETKLLEKLRRGQVSEVVKSLHGEMERLNAYLKFSMDQDFDSKDTETFDIQKVLTAFETNPEYFFSFKPMFAAETGTNSRHINIFISSFLNQAEDPQELWKDYCKGEPYAENYSFVWPTMDTFGYNEIKIQMEQEYKDNNVKSDLFHMGVNLLAKNHIKAIKLEKLDMNPFYINLYYMAMISGKALAFFIGQLRMFETSTITLVGFSMGAVVAYNCLRDLYYMRKSNLIYNFVTIANPLAKSQLNPEIVKLSVGSFFNVFSMDDKVLKYLSSMISHFQNPVGLNELVYDGALYSAKKIKVMNFDMTSMVHCHMDYMKFLKNVIEFIKQSDKYKVVQDFLFS